jgi:hypothetical protein
MNNFPPAPPEDRKVNPFNKALQPIGKVILKDAIRKGTLSGVLSISVYREANNSYYDINSDAYSKADYLLVGPNESVGTAVKNFIAPQSGGKRKSRRSRTRKSKSRKNRRKTSHRRKKSSSRR